MALLNSIILRIYGGSQAGGLGQLPLVSVGAAPEGFRPMPPTIVDETRSWMITHAQSYTLYVLTERSVHTAQGQPGQLLICLFLPAQMRLSGSNSPLGLLNTIHDFFAIQAMPNDQLPTEQQDGSPFQTLLRRYQLEERPTLLPQMTGSEPASFQAENITQVDALMRYSRYQVLARVGRLEIGLHCPTTVNIPIKGNVQQKKDGQPQAPKPEAPKPQPPKQEPPKPIAPKPQAPKVEAQKPIAPKAEPKKVEPQKPTAPKPQATIARDVRDLNTPPSDYKIGMRIAGIKQRRAGFAPLVSVGVLAGNESNNMNRVTVVDEKPTYVIKHTHDYVLYMLIDRSVRPFDADVNGILSIAITIKCDFQLANGLSPYTLLSKIYKQFKTMYMTLENDGFHKFRDIDIDNMEFRDIMNNIKLEKRTTPYVEMNSQGKVGILRVPELELEAFFRDTQYNEFKDFKEIEVGTQCQAMQNVPPIQIPREGIKYTIQFKWEGASEEDYDNIRKLMANKNIQLFINGNDYSPYAAGIKDGLWIKDYNAKNLNFKLMPNYTSKHILTVTSAIDQVNRIMTITIRLKANPIAPLDSNIEPLQTKKSKKKDSLNRKNDDFITPLAEPSEKAEKKSKWTLLKSIIYILGSIFVSFVIPLISTYPLNRIVANLTNQWYLNGLSRILITIFIAAATYGIAYGIFIRLTIVKQSRLFNIIYLILVFLWSAIVGVACMPD